MERWQMRGSGVGKDKRLTEARGDARNLRLVAQEEDDSAAQEEDDSAAHTNRRLAVRSLPPPRFLFYVDGKQEENEEEVAKQCVGSILCSRSREEDDQNRKWRSIDSNQELLFGVCVNGRGKVVISSTTPYGLANPRKNGGII
ncbi:hypothetical protein Syun_006254 [Stephania yunnanensis]|uniref:Uncharacterized protein n=1 Tax=Stephania yunnanensis TaxID=152371 RepID=A0AAP0KW91_9MAGN